MDEHYRPWEVVYNVFAIVMGLLSFIPMLTLGLDFKTEWHFLILAELANLVMPIPSMFVFMIPWSIGLVDAFRGTTWGPPSLYFVLYALNVLRLVIFIVINTPHKKRKP